MSTKATSRATPRRQRGEGQGRAPAAGRVGRVGEPVDDADEAGGAGEGPGDVEAAGGALALDEDARGQGGDEQADRHVDEERPAPVVLGEGPTEDEADGRTDARHGGVHAHGAVALLARGEGRRDEREGGGRRDGGAGALDDARGDEHGLVDGEAADERGRGEEQDAGDEHPAAAEQVAEAAAEQQQAAEGEGVGVDDPREVRVAEPEVGLDVGQRDVDDGAVEHDHQLRAADDGEREAETARARLGLDFRFGFGDDALDGGVRDHGHGGAFRGQGREDRLRRRQGYASGGAGGVTSR